MKPLGPTSVRIWIAPASDQDPWQNLEALLAPRPVDQAQWSSGAWVENGRPHADLFWREAEGSGDGVKPATLTVSRPAGAGRRARHLFGRVLAVVPPRPA